MHPPRRVVELDRKRNASLKLVSELSPRERDDAVARMEENALIVQWVQQCLERRISSYRWALERLVIQAPDDDRGRCRPPDQGTRRAHRQSAGADAAGIGRAVDGEGLIYRFFERKPSPHLCR